jgi:hypothetical protein
MESSHPPIPIDQQSLVALNCLSPLHVGLPFQCADGNAETRRPACKRERTENSMIEPSPSWRAGSREPPSPRRSTSEPPHSESARPALPQRPPSGSSQIPWIDGKAPPGGRHARPRTPQPWRGTTRAASLGLPPGGRCMPQSPSPAEPGSQHKLRSPGGSRAGVRRAHFPVQCAAATTDQSGCGTYAVP